MGATGMTLRVSRPDRHAVAWHFMIELAEDNVKWMKDNKAPVKLPITESESDFYYISSYSKRTKSSSSRPP